MDAEQSAHLNGTRPILCGTDFSPTAKDAVDIAAGLARRLKTKLNLVHITAFRSLGVVDPSSLNAALEQERAELNREVERLRKEGSEIESQFRSGSPFEELITAAVETNARLIVLGAVGHSVARRLLIGSVAERTAEASPIPTLVVRPGGKLKAWVRGDETIRVLLGYDFSPAGDAALEWVSRLLALGQCEIHIVHLYRPTAKAIRLEYKEPLPLNETPEPNQSTLQRELEARVAKIIPADAVTLSVQSALGAFEGCLFEISHVEKVDLVVVGTHQRAGLGRIRFGSVSRSVLHHARTSVAIIPPREDAS
jgi:nucleotide-binding universal stress UspA family protein